MLMYSGSLLPSSGSGLRVTGLSVIVLLNIPFCIISGLICVTYERFFDNQAVLHCKLLFLRPLAGTPRTSAEPFEECHKYSKQMKRESPPIRSFEGGITKGKPYEGVNTIKEMGRSIHEIPRQELAGQDSRKTPDMGPISQVGPRAYTLGPAGSPSCSMYHDVWDFHECLRVPVWRYMCVCVYI